jgi:hypothetical protein
VAPYFSKSASLLLLQAVMETVQSVVTIKCALDRTVYTVITHYYRIKINCLLSVGVEMSNRNIKL